MKLEILSQNIEHYCKEFSPKYYVVTLKTKPTYVPKSKRAEMTNAELTTQFRSEIEKRATAAGYWGISWNTKGSASSGNFKFIACSENAKEI